MSTHYQPKKTFSDWADIGQWFRIRFSTLWSRYTPPALASRVVPHGLRELLSRRRYSKELVAYLDSHPSLVLSSTWFLKHYGKWRWFIRREGLTKKNLRLLEIGSWEGMSAHFFLSHLPNAHLTAVDTWMGSQEHSVDPEELFSRFSQNLSQYSERLDVRRMTSDHFFDSIDTHDLGFQSFDLVHVDGDHSFEQVQRDAENAWRVVRNGGFIAFDDYFWVPLAGSSLNPGHAINGFLQERKGHYRLVDCTYQLLIQKLGPS